GGSGCKAHGGRARTGPRRAHGSRLSWYSRPRGPRRRSSDRIRRRLRPLSLGRIPRAPWSSLLGRPSHDLSLKSLRLEDLVGGLVRDISEMLDEIDVFIVREIGFPAA